MPIRANWLLVILIWATFSQAEVSVHFAYENATQFPYYIGDSSEVLPQQPGAAVELLKLLENIIPELKISFSRCHWKQCLHKLQSGKVDGIFNASFTEERLLLGHYPWKNGKVDDSRRITTISYHFYRLKGSRFNWNGKNITGLYGKIGTPLAYSIEGHLQEMGIKILSSPDVLANFSNLRRGVVQAIALQDVTGDYYLERKSGLKNIEKVYPALKTKAYYLILSKQFKARHPELSEKVWNAIGVLREKELQELVNSYM